ncbi:hypothetical protein GXY_16359 [Novacetimonas hansenii ATCC 23769]|uniref:Uncharacterized protein n=1 Tax=Novacetimonas hansenii ATCC 23769 TaxID=714995 RepID=D5QJD8_NOVHA|nr:hypothetical protein GXY_16359 [Novacetimonas hansenii ATCC 23769]
MTVAACSVRAEMQTRDNDRKVHIPALLMTGSYGIRWSI